MPATTDIPSGRFRFNLGIIRIAPQKKEGGADQISRVSAELYCQRTFTGQLGSLRAVRESERPTRPGERFAAGQR